MPLSKQQLAATLEHSQIRRIDETAVAVDLLTDRENLALKFRFNVHTLVATVGVKGKGLGPGYCDPRELPHACQQALR